MASTACDKSKKANQQARRETSKENTQKEVSAWDKCRFGSNVHDFIEAWTTH